MSHTLEITKQFYDACESGLGWDACSAYCHTDATFSAQAGALAGVQTLAQYTEWMKGMKTPLPDASYELKCLAEDAACGCVLAFGVYKGTHTGPGGPVEPTGKTAVAQYVYIVQHKDGLITHLTKVWNDMATLQQLGWA